MDIKFDAAVAERLIQHMNRFCTGISTETKDLRRILNNPGEWNDDQMKAFQANMDALAKNLNQVLRYEVDYMDTFYQRVSELKG